MIFPRGVGGVRAPPPAPPTAGGDVGFSFSPGGLLLPYHMGVADCLIRAGRLDPSRTLLAGSSAGAIAAAAVGCGLDPLLGLEGTIAISDRCRREGVGARGNLGPLLAEQLDRLIDDEAFEFLRSRREYDGVYEDERAGTGIALAYREVFPRSQSYLQTTFATRADLFRAVGWSCAFPFFTTNFPCAVDFGEGGVPRLLVDGYFALPRAQFGCPVLEAEFPGAGVARTVAIACIPQEIFGMDNVFGAEKDGGNNLISIDGDGEEDPLGTTAIFQIATQPTSRKELTDLFKRGYRDAERWCRREEANHKKELEKK